MIVYGFSAISALRSPVASDQEASLFVRVAEGTGGSSGNKEKLGVGSMCLK